MNRYHEPSIEEILTTVSAFAAREHVELLEVRVRAEKFEELKKQTIIRLEIVDGRLKMHGPYGTFYVSEMK